MIYFITWLRCREVAWRALYQVLCTVAVMLDPFYRGLRVVEFGTSDHFGHVIRLL